MTFLFPALAIGAAAAVIPLIIHLLNRTRYRVVRWGAMHLLDPVVRVNRRRIRLEQLLLLAVRTGIPATCALFMAKPVLTGSQVGGGERKSSVVVALDNSYSMEAGGGDASLFRKAVSEVDRMVGSLRYGSDVACIPLGGGGTPQLTVPTVNLRAFREALMSLRCGYGKADIPQGLRACLRCFSQMDHADRELIVASDFQRISWAGEAAVTRRKAFQLLRSLALPPRITFLVVGGEVPENVVVESLTLSSFVVGVGQKVKVRATVRNDGKRACRGLRVHFVVDGRQQQAVQIALESGESTQVLFPVLFQKAGSHVVSVAVDADPLTADNVLSAALPVVEAIKVLLIDGDPGSEALSGETDYLRIALSPFEAAGADRPDLIRCHVLRPNELSAEKLQGARVVVCANVERFGAAERELLEDFVRAGGGLLLFPGPRCDLGWYNQALYREGEGLLAAPLAPPRGRLRERKKSSRVVSEHYEHEALGLFNLPENGSLGGAEVYKWCPLEVARADPGRTPSVCARLESGDPFLCEWSYGQGKVMYCATACDDDWSPLPLRPFYVPLMQQLLTYLASTVYPPRNVTVGKPLVLFLPAGATGELVQVVCPGGTRRRIHAVAAGPRAAATFLETELPGLYTFEVPGGRRVHFVVRTSREESRLERLAEEEIARCAAEAGARVVRSEAQWRRLRAKDQHGRELWRHFFWAAVFLLMAELFLQQLFGRRKGSA